MQSKAKTVKEYLASLPEDRRKAIQALRAVILKNLDKDYEEGMQYGGICYSVPHRIYPNGYHCDPKQPLPCVGLGSQKNHISIGMMCHYFNDAEDAWFRAAWLKTGKKLDMGKCCVRFKKIEDVPLEVVGEAIRRMPAKKYIAIYEKLLGPERLAKATKKAATATAAASSGKTRKKTAKKVARKAIKKVSGKGAGKAAGKGAGTTQRRTVNRKS